MRRRGFTLIEAALAIVIVGTGCVAAAELFSAVTQANREARRLTVASGLARHVEEAMSHLPFNDPIGRDAHFGPEAGETLPTFNDVDDFHGFDTTSLAGPIDALRQPIPELSQYAQRVTVTSVNARTLATPGTGAVRIDVAVLWRPHATAPQREVTRTTWYRLP